MGRADGVQDAGQAYCEMTIGRALAGVRTYCTITMDELLVMGRLAFGRNGILS